MKVYIASDCVASRVTNKVDESVLFAPKVLKDCVDDSMGFVYEWRVVTKPFMEEPDVASMNTSVVGEIEAMKG